MTLGNMRELGLQNLIAFCLPSPKYPDGVEVPSFQRRIKCGKCSRRGRWVDVRPNWKRQPVMPTKLRYD